jgi:Methyltransferase domain
MKTRVALRQVVDSQHPTLAGAVAVDVGCGTGEIVSWLVADGFSTYGCEVNAARAAEARTRNPSAAIFCTDVRQWTPPRVPSLVTCMEVIEHIDRSQQAMLLRRIRQWFCCDSSVLILSTPQQRSLVSITERLYCRWKKLTYDWWDPTHLSVLPRRVMRRELVRAGFTIVDELGVGLVPDLISSHLGPLRRLVRDCGHRGVLGAIAFDIVYICRPAALGSHSTPARLEDSSY